MSVPVKWFLLVLCVEVIVGFFRGGSFMNMLKTNLLLLTFGVSMVACAADEQPAPAAPVAQEIQTSAAQDTTADDIRIIRETIDSLSNNPAIKAGDAINKVGEKIGQIPNLVREAINKKDAQYRDALVRAPYKTVAMTVGGVIYGSVIGITALVLYVDHKRAQARNAYWDQYYQDCAKRDEEFKKQQEIADHAWVQGQRREEEQQKYATYFSEPCCR